jgi:DNA-binding response OmpR family regulator
LEKPFHARKKKMMQRTILVVDDDKKTVDLIRLYLEKERYQVLVAFDGPKALELARNKQLSLIILDWMLPGIDGLDVCRILRAEGDIPIILLTARSTEDEKLLGLNARTRRARVRGTPPRQFGKKRESPLNCAHR